MDILFAATELAPHAKVGGLADVTAALTKTLRQHGHHVTLALPRFSHFARAGLLVARRLTPLNFELGNTKYSATVYDGRLPSGVDITLLDLPGAFDRDGIYGDKQGDYADNPLRFAAFSRAVVEMTQQRLRSGNPFDIVHVHDWPTALVPLYGKRLADPVTQARTRYVLTIHNLAYQGITEPSMLGSLGIGSELFNPDGVEFYGKLNLLKAGLVYSDAITTVSDSYAREIQTPEQGRGLDGVLRARKDKLAGITNGIDYALWNPATDPALVARFDAQDMTNKGRCKTALLAEVGLEMVPTRPLVAMVGRLVEQKGLDLVLDALPRLLRSDVALLFAGDGDQVLVDRLQAAAQRFAGRVAFVQAASEPLVHRVFAGADMVLVPSRFEPCGTVQLYGQRYGAVPIARATGGLKDTVVDCDASLETGSGFLFDEESPAGVVSGVQRALAAFATERWSVLQNRVMRLDLGWDRAAHRYAQLYRTLAP